MGVKTAVHQGQELMGEHRSREPIDWEEEEERLSARALAAGDATGWFEQLYAAGASGRVQMPWSRVEPHRLLTDWPEGVRLTGGGKMRW